MQRTLFDAVLGCIRAHDVNTLNVAAEVLEALLGKSSASGCRYATAHHVCSAPSVALRRQLAHHVAVHCLQCFTCNLLITYGCTIYSASHATCPSYGSAPSTVLHMQPTRHVPVHHLQRFMCRLRCPLQVDLGMQRSCWMKPRQPRVTVSQCCALQ